MTNELPEITVVFSVYPEEYEYMGATLREARKTANRAEDLPGWEVFDAPEFGPDSFGTSQKVAPTAEDRGANGCTYVVMSQTEDVMDVSVSNLSGDSSVDTCDQAGQIVEMLF